MENLKKNICLCHFYNICRLSLVLYIFLNVNLSMMMMIEKQTVGCEVANKMIYIEQI
jgi:hypothetical protein